MKESYVTLKIFDLSGQEIKTLVAEYKPAGYYRVKWDGRDNDGKQMPSKIYIYSIKTNTGYSQSRKMILIK